MKKYSCLFACMSACVLLYHNLSFAGNVPDAVTITAGNAYYHFANNRDFDNSAFPNLAIAYNFTPHWAMEVDAGILNTRQSKATGDEGVHGALYTIDGIYRFTPLGHFEPYILGGIGILYLSPNRTDSEYPGNVNLGLGSQLFFGHNIALRAEFRDVYQTTGKSHNDYMLNFGVSFLFGGN